MNKYATVLLALFACAYLVQVQAGLLDKIEDAVGFGRDHDHDDDDKRSEKKDDHDEHTYEGGFKKQVMHSVADMAIDRLEGLGKEKIDNPLLKPMLDIASGQLKEKIHHKINDFGDDDRKEREESIDAELSDD